MAGLGSLLAGIAQDAGFIWRVSVLLAGLIGLIESVSFLRASGGPQAIAGRTLQVLDRRYTRR